MSEATICDRCGKASTNTMLVSTSGVRMDSLPPATWLHLSEEWEFCPECSKSFEEWRTQGKK